MIAIRCFEIIVEITAYLFLKMNVKLLSCIEAQNTSMID